MSKFRYYTFGSSALMAILMSTASIAPFISLNPANAEPLFRSQERSSPRSSTTFDRYVVPTGTQIPVDFDKEKILVTKEETVPVTLKVAANLKTRNGNVLIPYGSEIVGQIQPANGGSQFVAQKIVFQNGQEQSIDGTSRVVTRTEVVKKGASAGDILEGAAIGAAASAVLSGVLGKIDTEEVLGGAGLGALGGWLLGGEKAELISINPKTDLAVTLNSDLALR